MLKPLAFGALAVMSLCAAPAAADDDTPRRLVVNGTGEASARPDMAVISAGVVVQADTASAALADNTRAMNAVLEQLRAAGLAADDVQTAQFAVTPLYETPAARAGDGRAAQDRRLPGVEPGHGAGARSGPARRDSRRSGERWRQQHQRAVRSRSPIPSSWRARRATPRSPTRSPRPSATPRPPGSGSARSSRSRKVARTPRRAR